MLQRKSHPRPLLQNYLPMRRQPSHFTVIMTQRHAMRPTRMYLTNARRWRRRPWTESCGHGIPKREKPMGQDNNPNIILTNTTTIISTSIIIIIIINIITMKRSKRSTIDTLPSIRNQTCQWKWQHGHDPPGMAHHNLHHRILRMLMIRRLL